MSKWKWESTQESMREVYEHIKARSDRRNRYALNQKALAAELGISQAKAHRLCTHLIEDGWLSVIARGSGGRLTVVVRQAPPREVVVHSWGGPSFY